MTVYMNHFYTILHTKSAYLHDYYGNLYDKSFNTCTSKSVANIFVRCFVQVSYIHNESTASPMSVELTSNHHSSSVIISKDHRP